MTDPVPLSAEQVADIRARAERGAASLTSTRFRGSSGSVVRLCDTVDALRAENERLHGLYEDGAAELEDQAHDAARGMAELETLRGIAKRLAEDWYVVEVLHWGQDQPGGSTPTVTEAMTHAEIQAIYGKEQSQSLVGQFSDFPNENGDQQ